MIAFSTYWQNATTVYSRQNLSILHVDQLSPPQPYIIDPSIYRAIWTKLFNDTGTNAEDVFMMESVMYEFGWYLRLYQDRFSDDKQSPLGLLQNFLAIPLQFAATALQWVNATCQPEGCNNLTFPIPQNLITIAASAQIQYRLRGEPWTMALFMGIGGAAVVWVGSMLVWMLFQKDPLRFNPSGFPDLDSAVLSGESVEPGHRTFAEAAQEGLDPNPRTWSTRGFCRREGVRVEKRDGHGLVLGEVSPADSHESDLDGVDIELNSSGKESNQ